METTASFTGKIGTPSNGFTLKVALTYEGDASTNKTIISSIKGYVKRNDSSYTPYNTSKNATLKIQRYDEDKNLVNVKSITNTSSYSISSDSYYTWASGSNIEVPHLSNGTQSIKITFTVDGKLSNYYPVGTISKTITLDELHKAPDGITFTIEELNTSLPGVASNVFVPHLSKKRFTIDGTLYDGATASKYTIFNGANAFSSESSNVIDVDFSQNELLTSDDGTGVKNVWIRARITDSQGSLGYSDVGLYDYIPYVKPALISTSSSIRRNGQLSGKVKMNLVGTFFNSIIGSVAPSMALYYKYWKRTDVEPETWFEIPTEAYTIAENNISIKDWAVSKNGAEIDDVDSRYAYYFKIKAVDQFTNESSITKEVPIGEYVWAEYRDRVDFKKITIQGKNPFEAKEYDLTEYETLSGITTTRTRCIKKMDRVVIDFVIRCAISANTDTTIYTLPEELRPSQSVEFVAIANSGNTKIIGIGFINSNGMIRVNLASALTTSGYLRCCIVYDL